MTGLGIRPEKLNEAELLANPASRPAAHVREKLTARHNQNRTVSAGTDVLAFGGGGGGREECGI